MQRKISHIPLQSASKYVNKTRLNLAISYLDNSNISITELCLECGFDSQRTFNRVFKEEYKMSPREYRNSLSMGHTSTTTGREDMALL